MVSVKSLKDSWGLHSAHHSGSAPHCNPHALHTRCAFPQCLSCACHQKWTREVWVWQMTYLNLYSHLCLGINTGSLSQCSTSWNFCCSCMAQYYLSAKVGHSLFCLGISASTCRMAVLVHSPRVDMLYISAVQFKPTYLTFAQALYLLPPEDLKGSHWDSLIK